MTESDDSPKSEPTEPAPKAQNADERIPPAPKAASSRLLERMRRVDPTFAKRYHQRSGE